MNLEKVFDTLMIKLILNLSFSFILLILSPINYSYSDSVKFYSELVKDWPKIFPDSNRNAAGPKFYNHILKKYTYYDDFKKANKLYCAV